MLVPYPTEAGCAASLHQDGLEELSQLSAGAHGDLVVLFLWRQLRQLRLRWGLRQHGECGPEFGRTVVCLLTPLKSNVSTVEEHDKTEQEDGGETKDDQGNDGGWSVQRVRWERDQPSDGVNGQFTSS